MSPTLCSVSVRVCPECGTGHESLSLRKLGHTIGEYNAFASCPVTKAPILFRMSIYDENGDVCPAVVKTTTKPRKSEDD